MTLTLQQRRATSFKALPRARRATPGTPSGSNSGRNFGAPRNYHYTSKVWVRSHLHWHSGSAPCSMCPRSSWRATGATRGWLRAVRHDQDRPAGSLDLSPYGTGSAFKDPFTRLVSGLVIPLLRFPDAARWGSGRGYCCKRCTAACWQTDRYYPGRPET